MKEKYLRLNSKSIVGIRDGEKIELKGPYFIKDTILFNDRKYKKKEKHELTVYLKGGKRTVLLNTKEDGIQETGLSLFCSNYGLWRYRVINS